MGGQGLPTPFTSQFPSPHTQKYLKHSFFHFWAAAPKGSMTYAFTHMGYFLLLLFQNPTSRPKSQLQGPNSRLFSYAVMEYYKREKSYCRVNFQTSVSVHLSICPTFPFHWPPWLKISSLRSDFAPLSPQISPSKPQIRPSRPQISPSRPRSSP